MLIKLAIVDDHTVVREGFLSLLSQVPGVKVVGVAENGRAALALCDRLLPDILLMDVSMPKMGGLQASRILAKSHPQIKIIMLSAHSDALYLSEALSMGAAGYVTKHSSLDELTTTIKRVHAGGHAYLSPRAAKARQSHIARVAAPHRTGNRLTERETMVLECVSEGHSNKGMADVIGISIKTIEKHRQNLMQKLDIRDTAGLTRYALSNGISRLVPA